MITIVDYRAGNGPSVAYACAHLGLDAVLTGDPDVLSRAERIILPGVGAAGATMASLAESQLIEPLRRRVVDDGAPFLGICIGMQVLFDHSEEGDTKCLGWIPGAVRRFPETQRVPQIGWNAVTFRHPHPLNERPRGERPENLDYFYFVNSYYCAPSSRDDVLGETTYGETFCSIVAHDNIAATQFHVEKSGPLGLRILGRFATWSGQC